MLYFFLYSFKTKEDVFPLIAQAEVGAKLLWCLAKDVGDVLAQLIDVEYVCLENSLEHSTTVLFTSRD